MSIIDLTSMAKPQEDIKREINQRLLKLKEELPDYCYQCAKCTAGCEAHKLLELEPHKIVALLKRGLIDEMTNSDVIWTCMSCFKCWERCPQKVAPVEILFALKNLSVASGKQIPGQYTSILQSVLTIGLIQDIQTITSKEGKTIDRTALSLPQLSKPLEPMKFQAVIAQLAMEKI
ncbi:MAG: 4Fe-4S dicluster domain-containing protein [Candidatus Thermoplasmatota archaeon]|nr:4Fe-4S dicluster domain-containing protein [Candidatus Thermoplasmatota archaeon]MBU1941326.1 4Fe-4S dicluster domain-containing protein [Candidatus Thermoplasmatota archaeon]